uniref:UBA domain-containing protein n=2 Tax=Schistocephalus solidus TaxID=70667 RepID=A0A0X3PP40_SCHSO
MMVTTEFISSGWLVSDEYRKVLDGISSAAAVHKHLVETDMREYGVSWLDSKKTKDVLIGEGQVLQVVRVRNIAISQAEEDFLASSSGDGPRLLKLVLTDGKTNISALDMDNSPRLSSETWPGTKIRLTGRVPIRCGFLLLRQNNFEVLEGCVEQLYRDWLLTKDARGGRRTKQLGPDAPPPFAPFGTADAAKLIYSQNQFFANLRASSNSGNKFNSIKQAMASTTKLNAQQPGDTDFEAKRREFVAQAQRLPAKDQAVEPGHKFIPGGSKFAISRAEQAFKRDHNLAELLAMGYSISEATSALEAARDNLTKATDLLASKQLDRSLSMRGSSATAPTAAPSRGRGGGRGGRSGRGGDMKFAIDMEDDPGFDPVLAAERGGLKGKPSNGPIPLSEFMSTPLPQPSRPSRSTPSTKPRLPPDTVVLARAMSGDYEPARVLGLLPEISGEAVALVIYAENPELEEEVPLSMLRTLEKEEITRDMLYPVRGAERPSSSMPYAQGDTGSARYAQQRGGDARSNYSRPPRRSFDGHRGGGGRGFSARGRGGSYGRSRGPRR